MGNTGLRVAPGSVPVTAVLEFQLQQAVSAARLTENYILGEMFCALSAFPPGLLTLF